MMGDTVPENTLVLETKRMTAVPVAPAHLDFLLGLHTNPQVMQWLGGVSAPEETDEFLEYNLAHWRDYGFGIWVWEEKETHTLVGRAGLRWVEPMGKREVELAYMFDDSWWGKGLATEASQELLHFGFSRLQLPNIVSFTTLENIRSQKVMERLGMERETTYKTVFDDQEYSMVLYRMLRESFNPSKA